MAEAGRRLTRRFVPKALAAGFRRRRGKPLGGLDMCGRKTRQRYGIRDEQLRQRTEASLEPLGKPAQPDSLANERSPEASEAGGGARAKDCLFKPTRSEEHTSELQ